MIPFLAMKDINLRQRDELHAALDRVLDSGWWILGKETEAFEREFADYCGAKHTIGVANGLDAMHLVLRAWGVGAGDEVIVPSNTYIATWLAVTYAGATPVPVEPVEGSFNLDPDRLRAAITPRTKAIIPVHLYGQPAQVHRMREIADPLGIKVLEDAAQAHGGRLDGKRVGALGHAAAFSFYPGKNLGALGDGGAITTDDDALAEQLRVLRNYGSRVKYHNEVAGFNSRLDELHSAFLRAKLPLLDADNARRVALAGLYQEGLADIDGLTLPAQDANAEHVWHVYVIRTARRAELAAHLQADGIGSLIHYPVPPHLQPAYAFLGLPAGSQPLSERIHEQVLSLPIGPTQSDEQTQAVIASVRRFFGR
ncbi:DegT/DnrJ/EryC1/StrS family aminotransferase [Roseateles sp.]|uniref:DegT/DnrJ/EryC1/StrS family aminotransferase n=1 Tax=Roseateles sp. TaxID=1971397 RepID=UPI0031DF5285